MRAMGSSVPRGDAPPKTSGAALYSADVETGDGLWGHVVFADVPHARIRELDVSAAAAHPGVEAVLTDADAPRNRYGIIYADQPVFCGVRSTEAARTVRWVGDKLCLIVADSKATAVAAAAKVQVEFEPLPAVTDTAWALRPDAPRIHDYADYAADLGTGEKNVLQRFRIRHGDIEAGWAQAEVSVSDEFTTHGQEHAYMEPEAGVAWIEPDGRVAVHTGGQWMHDDRAQIADVLNIPESRVKVSYAAVGGAFGGKEDVHLQVLLALAAFRTGRRVRGAWTRAESMKYTHKRHPFRVSCKLGARRDGMLTALQADLLSDAGPYASTSHKVLGNACLAMGGCYNIPHAHVDARAVLTNNAMGGAFRGFGSPQAAFALETLMNRLAEQLNLDPLELRRRNAWREGAVSITQRAIPPGCMAREVLEAAQEKSRELDRLELAAPRVPRNLGSLPVTARRIARGRGAAMACKNVGIGQGKTDQCHAWIELRGGAEIEEAILGTTGAECGQGAHTVFLQMAADLLQVDLRRVRLRSRSTDDAESSGSASASRLTYFTGAAIAGAARRALAAWEDEERPARGEHTFVTNTEPFNARTGAGDTVVDLGYCAQIADVEVDLDTGHVTVTRLISANDVGRAVNPQLIEGQIEGAVAQGIGWTLYEDVRQARGRMLNPSFSTYLIPGVRDVPQLVVPVVVEGAAPGNPLHVKGMAEMALVPVAAAVAAAVRDATGVWIRDLPLTPENVWRSLQAADPDEGRINTARAVETV